MSNEGNSYSLLIGKLDRFIRKFYINKVIRGSLYFVALTIGLFLLFSLLEYYFYFGKNIRKVFFYSFIGTAGIAMMLLVLSPLLKFFSLGKKITHEQAANIIGDHFSDVKDKLQNILQLKKQSSDLSNNALIEASIHQKSQEIKIVPFKSAIDLGKNRKYFRYALPPFLLLIFLLFAAPSIIKDSTHRIVNNNKHFEKAAPFHFVLGEELPEVVQFEDYLLEVKIEGDALPNEAFIQFDDFQYKLEKVEANKFVYQFKNVQKDLSFRLFSGTVQSEDKNLKIIAKPNLSSFSTYIEYPKYLDRQDEIIQNIGDLVLPEGSRVTWDFQTQNTDQIVMKIGSKKYDVKKNGAQEYSLTKTFRNDAHYKIQLANKRIPLGDSIIYNINITKDEHPSISVNSFTDSLTQNLFYFIGTATDDYGLTALNFHYTIKNEDGTQLPNETIKLKGPSERALKFDHIFDLNELDLKPGQEVSYYFEVFDNDGVNGHKSTKTSLMAFKKPSIEEYEKQEEINEEEIKDNLKESIENIKKLKEEIKSLREKLVQEKELNWQDKKELEKLLNQQKELQEKLQEAKEKFDENLKNQEEFNKQSEEVQEKQEQIQKMFEEVMDSETQELMQKIQELMEELDKDQAMEMMEEMEMDDQEMEQEMDRLLELFKQLEVEKEIKDAIEALEELAEKQEKLSQETLEEEKPQEALKEEQEKLNEEFKEVKEKIAKLQEKNKELSPPKDMGDEEENDEQMEEIQEQMENSSDSLEKKESQKAAGAQKKAAEEMKKMAGSLQNSMQAGEEEQLEEDIKALRQLLENLVDLSFDQEQLINDLGVTPTVTPRYIDLVQIQFGLKDNFGLIQDSLHALSKRVSKIETFVTEKVNEIDIDMESGLDLLEERKKFEAKEKQRRTMKNVNDLALMLSDAMEQMQQQMSGMMSGSQCCEKPGGSKSGKSGKSGKIPMDKITEGQEKLNEAMKKMAEGRKKGKSGKDGENGSEGKKGEAKEFAKAAARQAALRRALEELNQESKEQGKGSTGEIEELIDQMDKIETELVNKRLDNEMLKRQQDILTRLLKAENAQRQREYDNKRKADQGTDKKRTIPDALQKYLKERDAEIDLYKSVSPDLKPFYKTLVDKYYKELKNK